MKIIQLVLLGLFVANSARAAAGSADKEKRIQFFEKRIAKLCARLSALDDSKREILLGDATINQTYSGALLSRFTEEPSRENDSLLVAGIYVLEAGIKNQEALTRMEKDLRDKPSRSGEELIESFTRYATSQEVNPDYFSFESFFNLFVNGIAAINSRGEEFSGLHLDLWIRNFTDDAELFECIQNKDGNPVTVCVRLTKLSKLQQMLRTLLS